MNKEWQEMQRIWAETNPGGPDVDRVLNYVVERAERFDRKTRNRNLREWIGGAAGAGMVAYMMTMFESEVEIAFGISMAVFVVGLCAHLWVAGRSGGASDPALSRPQYRAELEEKFLRQVRMLRRAKYWFAIPLVATGVTTAWAYAAGSAGRMDWFYFPLICVGTLVTWWVNDGIAIQCVRREWERVRRALDDGEIS